MTESPEPIEQPRIDYAERRRARTVERQRPRTLWTSPATIAIAVAVLVFSVVLFEGVASMGKIHPGVTVSGVDVGGMIPEKAALVLKSGLSARTRQPVTIVHEDREWDVSASAIGLAFDYEALARDAMKVGRTEGVFGSLGARARAWFAGTDIDAIPRASAPEIGVVLDDVAAGTDVDPVDATVTIEGAEPVVAPSKPGLMLDRTQTTRAVIAAMLSSRRQVAAPIVTAPVDIDDTEANAAAALAKQMLSGPVKLTFENKTWTFDPEQIAAWIDFHPSGSDAATATSAPLAAVRMEVAISADKTAKPVTKALGTKVGHKAVNARFKTSSGSVTLVPSKNGIGPDFDTLARELTETLSDPASTRSVAVRTTVTEPEITTADAREMGIKRRFAVYTTTYAASNRSRVNNIHTLGDALNGTLIAPGKTFSFNKTIGQRTAAKGYEEANAIVDGKLVPQLGGGICQVGTTIFNTVFESGLPVLERKNHSFYISHYPKGRDATISWGGPDFKFKNDTDHWVLIAVSYTSSSITIALYGTDPGYEVESDVSDWRNIKPYSTQKIKDPKVAKGAKIVEDPGVEGKSITVERTVTKDGKVVHKDKFVSVYRPKTEVVRVGTKEMPKETDPETDVEVR